MDECAIQLKESAQATDNRALWQIFEVSIWANALDDPETIIGWFDLGSTPESMKTQF